MRHKFWGVVSVTLGYTLSLQFFNITFLRYYSSLEDKIYMLPTIGGWAALNRTGFVGESIF